MLDKNLIIAINSPKMRNALNNYQKELITKIRSADSNEEVKRFCNIAVHELEGQQLPGHLIVRFLEKTISELAGFNPMLQDSRQWNNIITAKVLCNRLLQQYSFSHE